MDLGVPGVLKRRTWRWFQARLFGLSADSRTWTAIRNQPRPKPAEARKPETTAADINAALGRR